jgi:hypothetical protein
VNIVSDPPSATVSVDGKAAGITPLLIRNIPYGEHTVSVSREGYNESQKNILVKPNETADVNFKLTPVTFSVKIHTTPENAEVFWDGKTRGTTPVIIDNVSAGVHIVRIVKADHDELLDTVDVKTSLTEKTYTLKSHTGNIFIKTEPPGAEVIMNDKKAGLTPITINALPVKQYALKLRKDGYIEKDITVNILKDKTAEISEFFQEIDTQPPNIMFDPPASAARESKNLIRSTILDNQSVKEVLLLLKAEGMTNFRSVEMSNPGRIKNIYETTIPDIYLKKDSVLEYYIQACDSQNNCRTAGSKESPYKLRVHSLEPYTEGFILDVTSQEDTVKVTISLGSLDGVKKGDRFIVFRAGRELRDPKSNELLQIEETFIGTIVIRELMSHTAYATVSKPVIPVTKNDRIRKVPSAPKAGTTEGNYAAKIVLKWAPNSEPEVEGYRIFRSSAIDGNYQKIEEITGRDNTIYEDTDDMRDGLTYYYKIAAYNILGAESQKSEPILGRTKNVGPPPAHITTEGVCVREVHLRWDTIKQDPDTKSYIVYRSDTEKGQYREIAQVDSDTGTYTDRKNLEDGKAYFYKIAARSRHGSLGDL